MYRRHRHRGAIIGFYVAIFFSLQTGAIVRAGTALDSGVTASPQEGDPRVLAGPATRLLASGEPLESIDNNSVAVGANRRLSILSNEPLTLTIHSTMGARAVAALRLAEEGRKLLQEGRFDRALARLERSLALDAYPYSYFYLALVHYRLAHYQESLNFLEVAESRLLHPYWRKELTAWKEIIRSALWSARFAAADLEVDVTPMMKGPLASQTRAESKQGVKRLASADFRVAHGIDHLLLIGLGLGVSFLWLFCFVPTLRIFRPR